MASNDGFKKYVEAGAVLAQVTRARAEEIVRELVNAGQVQGGQAQTWMDDVVERSRKASEDLLDLIRSEVASQLASLGLDPQDLAKQVADILQHSVDVGREATKKAAGRAGMTKKATKKTAPAAKKTAAKKAPAAKKAAAKRPSAGKAAAGTKKTAAKRPAASKTAAKKTAAS